MEWRSQGPAGSLIYRRSPVILNHKALVIAVRTDEARDECILGFLGSPAVQRSARHFQAFRRFVLRSGEYLLNLNGEMTAIKLNLYCLHSAYCTDP